MDLLIKNGTVITGDGTTVLKKASVWIQAGRIDGITQGSDVAEGEVAETLDAEGLYVIPGVINNHAHGCVPGPLFSSGAKSLTLQQCLRNADRYMLQGTTTLINSCGLATMEEVHAMAARHPMRITAGTGHLPSALQAAKEVDAEGLEAKHLGTTAERQIEAGAVQIGEMGGGHTLGGGGQDYMYIPAAIKKETGAEVHPLAARDLKIAVVGRYMRPEDFDAQAVAGAIEKMGLADKLSVDRAREIVQEITLPPVKYALAGFDEATRVSAATGVPVMYHNTSLSAHRIIELAKQFEGTKATLVAGHCNHNMFEVEECVDMSRRMKDLGVVIDVSTLDCVITHWRNTWERIDALASENLIDTISTDFGAGHWDGILEAVHLLVEKGHASIAQAVAMATGNVARAFPQAAPERGSIEKGKVADIVLADETNIGRVETVIVGGKVVANGGWCLYEKNGARTA